MGGFDVERVTQAGNVQIAEALQSQNFVAGLSGWIIRADGSYEFGSGGTIRGDVTVSGTDGSAIKIDNNSGHASIFLMPDNYTPNTITNGPAEIAASSNGTGNASYGTLDLTSPQPSGPPTANTSLISLQSSTLDNSSVSEIFLSAGLINFQTPTLTQNGAPLPGSWVAGAALVANSGGIAATETVILTAKDANNSQPTFLASHYYRFTVEGQTQSTSTAVGPIFGIRKTNAAGTRYKWARQNTTTLGNPYAAHVEGEFQVGPSGQAADIVLTLQGAAGQTVTAIAATDNPLLLNIYDMGPTPLQKTLYLPVL